MLFLQYYVLHSTVKAITFVSFSYSYVFYTYI